MARKPIEYIIKELYGRTYDLIIHNTKCRAILDGIGSYIPYVYNPLREGSGETHSAEYCYSVWLKHLTLAMDNGMKRYPEFVVELGPGASIGTGLAAVIAGATHYQALDVLDYTKKELNLKIFDELLGLFEKRQSIPELIEFPSHILTGDYLNRILDASRIKEIRDSLIEGDEKFCSYSLSGEDANIIPANSIDFVFSHAVMEHVGDIGLYYSNMSKWLKPGGITSHQIDFECHNLAEKWNGHWTYSNVVWKLIQGRRKDVLNRHTHSDHVKSMQSANLVVVNEIKFDGEAGIQREELALRFKKMSDEDLKTKGSIILARKS